MIQISNVEIFGFKQAVMSARNSWNSWDKSDTAWDVTKNGYPVIGESDISLIGKLSKAGHSHAKPRRKVQVYCDITAPLYWWKQMDTYKIGTNCDSTSTMHTITKKRFDISDFSCEKLGRLEYEGKWVDFDDGLKRDIEELNIARDIFRKALADKREDIAERAWWQIIQRLPSSYNQMRSMEFNYENLSAMYHDRKGHKLGEWHSFCEWISVLPYARELIICKT